MITYEVQWQNFFIRAQTEGPYLVCPDKTCTTRILVDGVSLHLVIKEAMEHEVEHAVFLRTKKAIKATFKERLQEAMDRRLD